MTASEGEAETGIRTVRTIRDVDPVAWGRLAGPNPLLSHGWLRTMEEEWVEDVERVYFLIESGVGLVAAAACYVDEIDTSAESVDDLLFGRLRSSAIGRTLSLRPALVCGFPWSIGSGCITEPDVGEARRTELIRALVEAITRESLQTKRSAIFLSVTETEAILMRRLSENGYDRARHEPIYILNLEWTTFEAYRRSLPSPNIRKNIRRELNKSLKQGVLINEFGNPSDIEARLHEIVDRHFRRYGWPAFPYKQSWFQSIKTNLGSDAIIAIATKESTVIAVAVSLRKQKTHQMILACVDHAAAGQDLTHFNLSYYWPVDECIRQGDGRYVVGPGQRASRVRRGYQPLNNYIYCRPASAFHRLSIKLWLRLLSGWLRRKAR